MSLKAFHIVFVIASVVLGLGFGIWAIVQFAHAGSAAMMALGIASLVFAVGMVVYGVWFLRKLKNVSYL